MAKKTRRKHSTSQKLDLLKKHHLDKVPVSDLCDQADLQPSLFYGWQRRLFENGALALDAGKQTNERELQLQAQVDQLEARLAKKDSVIAEISAEFVALKKRLGGP